MLVATIVGNRPQFVKAAAVSRRLRERHDELLVHTGQHHDDTLSRIFFEQLGVPDPDRELGIAGGGNSDQTGRMLQALAPVLTASAPDVVLVYGDTNSTLAGALAGAQLRLPVAHVEAGMRAFDATMPEELNRVLTDHAASLLLAPSQTAVDNLERESLRGRIELVGDVMVDVAELAGRAARGLQEPLARMDVSAGGYLLATAHRAGNVDDPGRLRRLVELLRSLDSPVVFPVHPRTRARLESAGLWQSLLSDDAVRVSEPLGYLEFTALLAQASAVLTDSGGVQKEAYLAAVPCLTLRDRTEWVETVATGWNTLVDLDRDAVRAALARVPPADHPPLYGDGDAGARVVAALERLHEEQSP